MSNARWTTGAACQPQDLELFFPRGRGGRNGDPTRGQEAKAICARCDIRERCLTEALAEEAAGDAMRWGIRGGLDEVERAQVWGVA
jgi:WhiB family transcriptional regulator, redox-sensing transcriptional regulator